jgi:hypothetical protein
MLEEPDIENIFGDVIDFDKEPKIPLGWSIHKEDQLTTSSGQPSYQSGRWEFNHSSAWLYRKVTSLPIKGHILKQYLNRHMNMGAQLLDHLLVNQNLIPEDWKDFNVYFWTIYRNEAGKCCVRCLFRNGKRWYSGHKLLDQDFDKNDNALIYVP